MNKHLLQTERTVIGKITLDDADFFLELLNSPGWLQFIGDRDVNTESEARQFISSRFLNSYEKSAYGYYRVKLRTNGEIVGICGFTNRDEYENPDFGFAFLPRYHGMGLALESSVAVLDYGQRLFGFSLLDAGTRIENYAAIRLLGRLGFSLQGNVKNKQGQDDLLLYRWSQ